MIYIFIEKTCFYSLPYQLGSFMSATTTSTVQSKIGWLLVAILGAFAFGYIALRRGETINAMWILTAAVCVYFIAYRFYSLFIQNKVLQADATRMTPSF